MLKRYFETPDFRLRYWLHGSYKASKTLAKEVVKSKLGKQECAGIRVTETTERKNVSVDSEYTVRLHSEAPFGVVQWSVVRKINRDGQPYGTITKKLTLSDFGTGAKTALPDEK